MFLVIPKILFDYDRIERERTQLSSEINDARSAADLLSNEKVKHRQDVYVSKQRDILLFSLLWLQFLFFYHANRMEKDKNHIKMQSDELHSATDKIAAEKVIDSYRQNLLVCDHSSVFRLCLDITKLLFLSNSFQNITCELFSNFYVVFVCLLL